MKGDGILNDLILSFYRLYVGILYSIPFIHFIPSKMCSVSPVYLTLNEEKKG